MLRQPVIFLLGPTASGKTALACALAEKFPLDLVSVDSALVYRSMNIGTAKPNAEMLARYPHALIDLIEPNQAYSAADFVRDANAAIANSHAAGRVPLLVGGTMMYVKALTEGLSALPPADASIRAELEAAAAERGWPALHADLAVVDPATASRLAPNDAQRIQRALEVFRLVGEPLSSLQRRDSIDGQWSRESLFLGLVPDDRAKLHARINSRFQNMLREGLVDELWALRERYELTAEMPSMRCVGYRQAWQFLDGDIDQLTLYEIGAAATRQLAKRQLTWMRSMTRLAVFDSEVTDLHQRIERSIEAFVAPSVR